MAIRVAEQGIPVQCQSVPYGHKVLTVRRAELELGIYGISYQVVSGILDVDSVVNGDYYVSALEVVEDKRSTVGTTCKQYADYPGIRICLLLGFDSRFHLVYLISLVVFPDILVGI